MAVTSRSPVNLPDLRAEPTCWSPRAEARVPCPRRGDTVQPEADLVVILYWSDLAAVVRELKTACLAAGGSPAACQTE